MIGSRLGPYEITAKLGEGGMGEVYRATDGKLRREVAIKVLPAGVAEDADRLARFEREAQLLAQLHHPQIASIFGLEESGGTRALILELVEGPTLADRLLQGSLPIEDALSIARQIAEALEAAHGKGIVHRDLKPQNVKVRADGRVKVLDFGLAKALDPVAGTSGSATVSPTLLNSPTLTAAGTQLGVILGTAAYMAPEQARGAAVDKRADIWAFGVVLWEMLTGASLFAGDTVTDTLAGVLKTEIDLGALPAGTPAAVRRLLRRCLERDPKNRLHDIADARIVLDEVLAGRAEGEAEGSPTRPAGIRWTSVLPWAVAASLAALLLLRPAGDGTGGAGERSRLALEVALPAGRMLAEDSGLALAPDGGAVVFSAEDPVRGSQLWLRRLDDFEPQPLRGTEGAALPFWSPDSRSIGFFRAGDGSLHRYDLVSGGVEVLAAIGSVPVPGGGTGGRGASWSTDGTIVFAASTNGPIQRLGPGGAIEDVTVLDPSILDGSHRFPAFLSDGERFVVTLWSNNLETAARVGGVYLASLENGLERRLTPDASQAFVAGPDRLIVRRDGALVALTLDPGTFEVRGAHRKIADAPLFWAASGSVVAAANLAGDLAFALDTGQGGGRVVWLDRDGEEVGAIGEERLGIGDLALAPGGRAYAVESVGPTGGNIWVGDERRGVLDRLTPEGVDSSDPVWSPDGRRIAYVNEAEGSFGVHLQEADGSRAAELLLADPGRDFVPSSWSADGRYLLLDSNAKGDFRRDLWVYDFQEGGARELLGGRSASLTQAVLAPDGRWLAYVSDESGNPEVFVRPFPALDRRWKVSQGGADSPHWRRDARELLFVGLADGVIQVVDVAPDADGLEISAPRQLFVPRQRLLALAPAPDHDRFLAGALPADARQEPIRLILGWRSAPGSETSP
jgi:hypothetical protein